MLTQSKDQPKTRDNGIFQASCPPNNYQACSLGVSPSAFGSSGFLDPYMPMNQRSDEEEMEWLPRRSSRPTSLPSPPRANTLSRAPSLSPSSPTGRLGKEEVQETHTIRVDYDPITGNKRINQYEVLRELGRGCHGKVKLGRDTINGELVAIKIVHKNTRRRLGSRSAISTQMAKVQREIAILKKCRHPHVVQLKEVIDDPASRKIYMVLEYMDGGEVQFTNDGMGPILDTPTIRHILRNVIVGLEYLHRQGVIHRDIKPANLLWSQDGQVKISDFGVSFCRRQVLDDIPDDFSDLSASPPLDALSIPVPQSYPAGLDEEELELAKTAGSPAFFAPELCWSGDDGAPRPPITAAIDVWALGITLFCLVFGRPPFVADSEYELFETIPRAPLEFPPGAAEADPELVNLLQGLLRKDPSSRLTLAQARKHPWILGGLDDPNTWAQEADPDHYPKLEVTEEEVKHAVTIKERLRKHFRKLSESFLRTFGK